MSALYVAKVRTRVNPTEDPVKVERAVAALFPGISLTEDGGFFAGEADLEMLREEIARLRLKDSVRGHLVARDGVSGNCVEFSLSKQAAFMGRLNFSTGMDSPLGDIDVSVDIDSIEDFLEYLLGEEEKR